MTSQFMFGSIEPHPMVFANLQRLCRNGAVKQVVTFHLMLCSHTNTGDKTDTTFGQLVMYPAGSNSAVKYSKTEAAVFVVKNGFFQGCVF